MANVLRTFTMAMICSLLTSAHARTLSGEVRLFEGELTALLREFLTPLDPALIEQTSMPISVANTDLHLVVEDVECTGFSVVDVTVFNPPLPLLSNQVKLAMVMKSVKLDATSYNLTGVFLGSPVAESGTVWLSLQNLNIEMTFDADEFSTDPQVVICVKRGTFHISLTVAAVTGEFQGMPQVNTHMDLVGPIIIEQIQANINKNSDAMEDKLNAIFC